MHDGKRKTGCNRSPESLKKKRVSLRCTAINFSCDYYSDELKESTTKTKGERGIISFFIILLAEVLYQFIHRIKMIVNNET